MIDFGVLGPRRIVGRRVAGFAALLLALSGHAQEAERAASAPPVEPATVTAPAATAITEPRASEPVPAPAPAAAAMPPPRPRPAPAPPPRRPEPPPNPVAQAVTDLQAEVSALRATNERLDESNSRLTQLNGQLRQEVEALALELQTAREDARARGLLYGAGLILAGLLAGVLIKNRPRRSAWV